MTRILVTGGRGVLGGQLVPMLQAQGQVVRVMSRRAQPARSAAGVEWAQAELETGQGLAQAVEGADIIVHAASNPFKRTRETDVDGTARLLEAARAADCRHLVYISIVGVDRNPYFYYRHKLAVEQDIIASGLPWTILRTTQFFELIDGVCRRLKPFPVMLVPTDWPLQPLAASEAAEALVAAAAAPPAGRLPDMGGPEVLTSGDLLRAWLRQHGAARLVLPIPSLGGMAAAFRRGYNTCPAGTRGRQRWADWLAERYPRPDVRSGQEPQHAQRPSS